MKRKRKPRYSVEVISLPYCERVAGCNLFTKTTDLLKNTTMIEQWQVYGERCAVGSAMMRGYGRSLSYIPYSVKADDRQAAVQNVRKVLYSLRDGAVCKLLLACDGEIISIE